MSVLMRRYVILVYTGMHPTFCPQVFCTLHVIHGLQGFCLLSRKCLLVIIFTGSADSVEENATRVCVSEEVDDQEDQGYQDGRAK